MIKCQFTKKDILWKQYLEETCVQYPMKTKIEMFKQQKFCHIESKLWQNWIKPFRLRFRNYRPAVRKLDYTSTLKSWTSSTEKTTCTGELTINHVITMFCTLHYFQFEKSFLNGPIKKGSVTQPYGINFSFYNKISYGEKLQKSPLSKERFANDAQQSTTMKEF